ncbi:probable pectinesterase/pectinesterase inhibitor 51 [Nymphaea colorata]|nr:probable pectinesterase/pectinesterase inhibitor 51 [Nymphaea colorata]
MAPLRLPFLLFLLFLWASASASAPPPSSFHHHHHHSHIHHHSSHPSSSLRGPSPAPASAPSSAISQACSATRYPDTCAITLSQSAAGHGAIDLTRSAILASAASLQTARSTADAILASSGSDKNRTNAARNCIELLGYSARRLGVVTAPGVLESHVKDARAWLSAGLTYQYDCWSALKYVNTTKQVDSAMAFLADLLNVTSNALSMVFALDRFGTDTASWGPPQTERDGFVPATGAPSKESPTLPSRLQRGFDSLSPDVVVCKDGSNGCLGTIQAAVDSAPSHGSALFVIKIKEGVYDEIVRVPYDKTNVVFLGDGMGKTVITGNLNAQMIGVSTYNTATVGVNGDGFMASGITFQNTAGPDSHQAVAFRSDSDFSLIENCEFLGHQDTLYVHTLRQFYKSCRIQGTVDFIFGNSASVFHNCTILVAPRQLSPEKGATNTVTAHGRTDPAQASGLVFDNCVITGTDDYLRYYDTNPKVQKSYLGRPWKQFSRTVFLNSYLERIIRPEGWAPWDGDFALSTLYYGEFQNTGPGANITGRVPWSSQIPSQNVYMYSVEGFIQGSEWAAADS